MSKPIIQRINDRVTSGLRNWPYSIRKKILKFPAIAAGTGKTSLVVLCEGRRFLEGLWGAWSWLHFAGGGLKLTLLIDGKTTKAEEELLQSIFPGGRLVSLPDLLEQNQLPPELRAFVAGNWTARKLAAVYLLQRDQSVLYCDFDVLAFRRPDEILELMAASQTPAYLHDESGYHVDPWLNQRAQLLGLTVPATFNAGLVYTPKGSVDLELINALLDGWKAEFNSHHAEQTLFSALVMAKAAIPLPPSRYIMSYQGYWFWKHDHVESDWVARHYVGPVRHRMYQTAYPFLEREVRRLKS